MYLSVPRTVRLCRQSQSASFRSDTESRVGQSNSLSYVAAVTRTDWASSNFYGGSDRVSGSATLVAWSPSYANSCACEDASVALCVTELTSRLPTTHVE